MKNEEVIKCFLKGLNAQGSNLYSTGDKLINYNTCIAQINGHTLIINGSYYSKTTSRHQNLLKRIDGNYFTSIEITTEDLNGRIGDLINCQTEPL